MGLIESQALLGYLVFSINGGMIASKYGPRFMIIPSLILVGVDMLVTGFINSFSQTLLLRGVTGLAAGRDNVPALMLPAVWLSAKRRG